MEFGTHSEDDLESCAFAISCSKSSKPLKLLMGRSLNLSG